jgi:hypothetical protein
MAENRTRREEKRREERKNRMAENRTDPTAAP